MKLSKQQRKELDLGMEAVRTREGYAGDNYERIRLGATSDKGSVFMTPWELACDLSIESITHWTGTKRVLDLCAGYGALSLAHWHQWRERRDLEVTCIEVDERIAEIGELIFPEAKWLNASVFDHARYLKGKRFQTVPTGLVILNNNSTMRWRVVAITLWSRPEPKSPELIEARHYYWMRLGDSSNYSKFNLDNIDEVAGELAEAGVADDWERCKGGIELTGYRRDNYISLYVGDRDANLVRQLSDGELEELKQHFKRYTKQG